MQWMKRAKISEDKIKRYVELNNKGLKALTEDETEEYDDLSDELDDEIRDEVFDVVKKEVKEHADNIAQSIYKAVPRNADEDIVKDAADFVKIQIEKGKSLKEAVGLLSDEFYDEFLEWTMKFTNA